MSNQHLSEFVLSLPENSNLWHFLRILPDDKNTWLTIRRGTIIITINLTVRVEFLPISENIPSGATR